MIPAVDGVLHTVAADETLSEIASTFGVDTSDLASANGLQGSADQITTGTVLVVPGAQLASRAVAAASPDQAQASATPSSSPSPSPSSAATPAPTAGEPAPGTYTTYTVQDGDTLRSIADQFNLDILSLVAMNGIDNPDVISPGSTLRVSAPPKEYVVQSGDTLGDIAYRYSVASAALLRANGLDDPDLIVAGMTLVMPISAASSPSGSSASGSSASGSSASGSSASGSSASGSSASGSSASGSSSSGSSTSGSSPSGSSASAPSAPARATARPAPPRPTPTPAAAPAPASGTRAITAMVTGYAPGAGASSSHTASGTTTHWGTVAADTRLYPFGTRMRIQGMGDTVFTVEDTGSAVRGNIFDVWFPDAASARGIGPGTRQVTILGPGDN
jgi:LysM repeat protein